MAQRHVTRWSTTTIHKAFAVRDYPLFVLGMRSIFDAELLHFKEKLIDIMDKL